MAPKQKKKTGPSNAQIQETIDLVCTYFPNYSIRIENIRAPTREFVLRFYGDCVQELNAKCAFIIQSQSVVNNSDEKLNEIQLYETLSKIRPLRDADFILGDLYSFDTKRLNAHMKLIIHYLMFSETKMDEMVAERDKVFAVKEKMDSIEEESQKIQQDLLYAQIVCNKTNLTRKNLKELNCNLSVKYEESVAARKLQDKLLAEPIQDACRLKDEATSLETEIGPLKELDARLKQDIVNEKEIEAMIQYLNILKQNFNGDDNDEEEDDYPVILKNQVKTLEEVISELKWLKLPEEFNHLAELKNKLIQEKEILSYLSDSVENKEVKLAEDKIKWEALLSTALAENVLLKSKCKDTIEHIYLTELELNKSIQEKVGQQSKEGETIRKDVTELEDELSRLPTLLRAKLDKILATRRLIAEMPHNFIKKEKALRNRLGR